MNTQYAVCHLQRGSGNDAGMSCHIERKNAEGKVYVPENADENRTHLNRELINFPAGVNSRTDAIQYRIDNAKLHRKIGKNQTKAVRVMLSGTHEQMVKLEAEGRLNRWIDANIQWLKDTFGADNLVSAVLHMDEKTPHIHATVVPIVQGDRKRRKREGEKKYRTNNGPRLSADDAMARDRLRHYQDSYGAAMKVFGLERGIVGSTAKHVVNSDYYKQRMQEIEANIEELQKEEEAAREGRSRIFALFGKGELADAKQTLPKKDAEIESLRKQIVNLNDEKSAFCQQHKQDIAKLRNGYKTEIDKAIRENECLNKTIKDKDAHIAKQDKRIDEFDRKANPQRYHLSSGAELVHHFIPNLMYPSLHIWTKVGDEEYDVSRSGVSYDLVKQFSENKITIHELVNEVFEPWEQVSEVQANLLGQAFIFACGGEGQVRVGTGSGGSQSELPWRDKDKNKNRGARR